MRRFVTGLLAGLSLSVIVLIPMSTAAAAPYVYGCTPGQSSGGSSNAVVTIYNGSGTTANLTVKALTPSGTNISGSLGIASTFTLPATQTKEIHFVEPTLMSGFSWDPANANVIVGAIRIVSDQPIAAGMNHVAGGENFAECSYFHP
jgi:hypothetical protein